MIYLDLAHTRRYLSATKLDNNEPRIPPPPAGCAAGNTAETRRTTPSAEVCSIQPQQELSAAHKVRKAEYFHKHGDISRAAKVFTNDAKPTNDPGHSEPLRQLFPHPSADYDSPPKMGEDLPQVCNKLIMGYTTGIRKERKVPLYPGAH